MPVTPVVVAPPAPLPSPGKKNGWWKNGKWSDDQAPSGRPVADSVAVTTPVATFTVAANAPVTPVTPIAPSDDDQGDCHGRGRNDKNDWHDGIWKRDK